MQVLVTGANGFIGGRVAERLAQHGISVVVSARKLRRGADGAFCRQIEGDISDRGVALAATRGVDVVFHFAGTAHRAATTEEYRRNNVEATSALLESSVTNGVSHFVLASTIAVYGPSPAACTENSPTNPVTEYGKSKVLAEQHALEVSGRSGLAVTILRLSTVYGEGDPGNVGRLISAVSRHGNIVFGNGLCQKSMTHVDNVAQLCLRLALERPGKSSVYNVSDPTPYTLNQLIKTIGGALNREPRLFHFPKGIAIAASAALAAAYGLAGRKSPVTPDQILKLTETATCDTKKLREDLQFDPPISLQDGILETVQFMKNEVRTGGCERKDTPCGP